MWETIDISKERCEHRPKIVFIKHEKGPICGKNSRLIGYEFCEKCLRRYCEIE